MPGRKRKVVYPSSSKPKGPPRPETTYTSSNAVSIDPRAAEGREGLSIGDRVRIMETRPLSATKRWRLIEILEKAK